MKFFRERFIRIARKNIGWSSYSVFADAIKKMKLDRKTLLSWFNKFVEKDDFGYGEKRQVINHLCQVTSGVS